MPSLIELLWSANWVLASIWALRIWRLELVHRYPILFTYLALYAFLDLIGQWLYGSSVEVWGQMAYSIFWVVSTPLCWLFWFGVVFEVYGHMIEGYAGVRKLGRIVLYGTLAALAVGIVGFFYLNPYSMPDLNFWKSLWLKQEQGVYMGIAGLVFVLLVFKRTFSLVIPKNVQLIFSTFGLYFAGSAALMVIRTYVGPGFRTFRDFASMTLYVGCLAVGGILFSRAGETEAPNLTSDDSTRPEMAARAAQQLQTFNDRLVRVLNA